MTINTASSKIYSSRQEAERVADSLRPVFESETIRIHVAGVTDRDLNVIGYQIEIQY